MVGVGGCVCALWPDHEIGTIVKNEWLWEVNAERSWHKSGAISFRSRQTRDLMIVLIIKEKATLSVFLHFSSRELMTCPDSFKNALWYEGRNKLRAPGVWWPGDDTEKEKGKMIQRCISPICLGRDESGPWAGGTRKGENGEDRGSLEAVTWECHPGSEKTSGFWEAGVCDWDGGTSCLSGFFGQQDLNNVGGWLHFRGKNHRDKSTVGLSGRLCS